MNYETLDSELLSLPIEERARLARLLYSSVDDEASADVQPDIEASWMEEVERRSQQVARGEVETIPAAQVMSELRAQLNR